MSDQQRHGRPDRTSDPECLTYYDRLGLDLTATESEIRHAYRELSKRYHPDTTHLPLDRAKIEFQVLKDAYQTLSDPQKRRHYDLLIAYTRTSKLRPAMRVDPVFRPSTLADLDPEDRPLSSGELFALLMLGVTFLLCLVLAITLGLAQSAHAT